MSRPDAHTFYSPDDGPPQQGDILLGAVCRVVADDGHTPRRWNALDEHRALLQPAERAGPLTLPALRVAAGRALVMVCSHDCGLDKEFNVVVDELTDPDGEHRLDDSTAVAIAEAREDLDRTFAVSPLIDPDSVHVAGRPVERGLLMSGRVIGYLPVPELTIGDHVIIPESVVDLGYRSTLDRLAYAQRLTSVSEQTREQLRFALARLDVLRTPSLETQLSEAIGQRIESAAVSQKNPLVVRLRLADGTTLDLLPYPGSPPPATTARTRRSVRD